MRLHNYKSILFCAVLSCGIVRFLSAETDTIPDVVQRVQKSVVHIQAIKNYSYGYRYQPSFLELCLKEFYEVKKRTVFKGTFAVTGAGALIDASGLVVTNAHVVRDVNEIKVVFQDKSEYPAVVIGKDTEEDLAVLQIQGSPPLEPIPFAQPESVKVGQSVIAIGSPYGFKNSVTRGVISGIQREIEINVHHTMKDLIQTDAALNPGNSGGPLLNNDGELIGINTLGRGQDLNFAISVATITRLLPVLKEGGRDRELHDRFIRRFGFDIAERENEGGTNIVIRDVSAGAKAYRAGIRDNDVLSQIKECIPQDLDHVFDYAEREISQGEPLKLLINRDKRTFFTYIEALCLEPMEKR